MEVLTTTWLPYAYIIIAMPMYECALVPTVSHASTTRLSAVSIHINDAQSRQAFGVGCVTAVRYGGVMIVEYRDKVQEEDDEDAAWVAALLRAGQVTESSAGDGNGSSPSPHLPYVANHKKGERLREIKHRIWRELHHAELSVVLASTKAADLQHHRHRVTIQEELNTQANRGRNGSEFVNPSAQPRGSSVAVPFSTTPEPTVLRTENIENLSTSIHLLHGTDSAVTEEDRRSRSDVEHDDREVRGSGSFPLANGSKSKRHQQNWWQQGMQMLHADHVSKSRQPDAQRLWADVHPSEDFLIRGTFRQIGGMKYLDAVALMDGCPVSELVDGIKRWVTNLTSMPIKARPISLYLQRYEGISHMLRLWSPHLTHTAMSLCRPHVPVLSSTGIPRNASSSSDVMLTSAAVDPNGDSYSPLSQAGNLLNSSFVQRGMSFTDLQLYQPLHVVKATSYFTFYAGPLDPIIEPVVPDQLLPGCSSLSALNTTQSSSHVQLIHIVSRSGADDLNHRALKTKEGGPMSRGNGKLPAPEMTHSVHSTPEPEGAEASLSALQRPRLATASISDLPKPLEVRTAVKTIASGGLASSIPPPLPKLQKNHSTITECLLYEDTSLKHQSTPSSLIRPAVSPTTAADGAISSSLVRQVSHKDPLSDFHVTKDGDSENATMDSAEYTLAANELRELRGELEEVKLRSASAWSELWQCLEEYLQLGAIFLPRTRMDCISTELLHIKMLRQFPHDVPVKELHGDWLSVMMTVLTCPRHRIFHMAGGEQSTSDHSLHSVNYLSDYSNSIFTLHACDANQSHVPSDPVRTSYTIKQPQDLPPPRLLRELVIAPPSTKFSNAYLSTLKRIGLDTDHLVFGLTTGSLGLLAGVLRYYTDFLAAKYTEAVAADSRGTLLDVLCRGGYNVLLQRLWIWLPSHGDVRKKSRLRKVFSRQRRNVRREVAGRELEGGLPQSGGVQHPNAANPATMGFRSSEAYAIFDSVNYYLKTLDELQRRHNGENIPRQAPVKRRSVLNNLWKSKETNPSKGGGVSDLPPDTSGGGGSAPETPLVPHFEICIASDYYYQRMFREARSSVAKTSADTTECQVDPHSPPYLPPPSHSPFAHESTRKRSPLKNVEAMVKQSVCQNDPSAGVPGATTKSSDNQLLDRSYCGGEEVVRKRHLPFKKLHGFLCDNFEQWKSRHHDEGTQSGLGKRLFITLT